MSIYGSCQLYGWTRMRSANDAWDWNQNVPALPARHICLTKEKDKSRDDKRIDGIRSTMIDLPGRGEAGEIDQSSVQQKRFTIELAEQECSRIRLRFMRRTATGFCSSRRLECRLSAKDAKSNRYLWKFRMLQWNDGEQKSVRTEHDKSQCSTARVSNWCR